MKSLQFQGISILSKCNTAQDVFIPIFKKKRFEASSFLNLEQFNTNDNKRNTINTTNHDGDSVGTRYLNENVNETNSDFEEERCNYVDEENLKKKQSKIEQAVSLKNNKLELKCD